MLKSLRQINITKTVSRILLLTFSWVILPLLLLEILAIVLEPYLFQGLYQYDPDLGFRVRPHANGNNQFGFNDRDYPLEKDPEKHRILIVSDSFNWAGGKDANYTALLEKKFVNRYSKHQVDIINAGYPGTHTAEQLAMLKKYGLQYNPDLVILGFFAGNDFRDAKPNRKRIIVNDLYVDIDRRRELIIFGYPMIGKSRLLLFVEQKYKIWQQMQKAKKEAAKMQRNFWIASVVGDGAITSSREKSPGILSEAAFLKLEKSRLKFCHTEDLLARKRHKNINYILNSISEMQTLLSSRKIKLIVAIYPDEYQVNPQLFNQLIKRFNLHRKDYEVNCQQQILIRFLAANGIPYIDLLDRFKIEQKTRPLYLLREPHWNSAGNQLAAEMLFQYLLKDIDRFFHPQKREKAKLSGA